MGHFGDDERHARATDKSAAATDDSSPRSPHLKGVPRSPGTLIRKSLVLFTRKPSFVLGDPQADAAYSMFRTDFWHRVFYEHQDSNVWAHLWRRSAVTAPVVALVAALATGITWGVYVVPHHNQEAVAVVQNACHLDSEGLASKVFAGPGRTINVDGFSTYRDASTGRTLTGMAAAGTVSFYATTTGRLVCAIPDRF